MGSKRRRQADELVKNIPLIVAYSFIGFGWLGFTIFVSIREVLLRHNAIGHFLEQIIVLNILTVLTLVALITVSSRAPGQPDQTLAPESLLPGEKPTQSNYPGYAARSAPTSPPCFTADDEEDIPLRSLRNQHWVSGRLSKDRPSPLPLHPGTELQDPAGGAGEPASSTDTDGSYKSLFPEISPFPFAASPFVPSTAREAGEDSDEEEDSITPSGSAGRESTGLDGYEPEEGGDDSGIRDQDQLLPRSSRQGEEVHRSLFAENSSGGPRWCKKCDAWKPDRCHHCRWCKRCVLKMDHHCVWLATCVGYHNYKPFLLFLAYATILSFYIGLESSIEVYAFFQSPDDFAVIDSKGTETFDLGPVAFMILALLGFFFGLGIGSLAVYHGWLVTKNKTTLEDITHSYPTALLEHPTTPERQPASSIHGTTTGWRGDHLLTRPERVRLRNEASAINVYDLGWERNLRAVFGGPSGAEGRRGNWRWWQALWPPSRPHHILDATAGHFFEYDPVKLEKLRRLTAELRLGRRAHSGDEDGDSDDAGDD